MLSFLFLRRREYYLILFDHIWEVNLHQRLDFPKSVYVCRSSTVKTARFFFFSSCFSPHWYKQKLFSSFRHFSGVMPRHANIITQQFFFHKRLIISSVRRALKLLLEGRKRRETKSEREEKKKIRTKDKEYDSLFDWETEEINEE